MSTEAPDRRSNPGRRAEDRGEAPADQDAAEALQRSAGRRVSPPVVGPRGPLTDVLVTDIGDVFGIDFGAPALYPARSTAAARSRSVT